MKHDEYEFYECDSCGLPVVHPDGPMPTSVESVGGEGWFHRDGCPDPDAPAPTIEGKHRDPFAALNDGWNDCEFCGLYFPGGDLELAQVSCVDFGKRILTDVRVCPGCKYELERGRQPQWLA